MKLRGLLATLMFSSFIAGTAQAFPDDVEASRLIKACPEAYDGDDIGIIVDKLAILRKKKLTGDPRADGKSMCEKHISVIHFMELQINAFKSCEPSTEPLIKEAMKRNHNVQVNAIKEMDKLGCKY